MSSHKKERVTCKRPHPNPLFKEWLESLLHDALREKSHLAVSLKEALDSLSKYPLPLKSGAECAILKGFDKGLCRFIDMHLREVQEYDKRAKVMQKLNQQAAMNSPQQCLQGTQTNSKCNDNTDLSTKEKEPPAKYVRHSPVLVRNKKPIPEKQTRKLYKPTYRSGGYAILVALMEQQLEENSERGLIKEDLIKRAQKHCDTSFYEPKPGTDYTAWINAKRLLSKGLIQGLICSQTNDEIFLLTELGEMVASMLMQMHYERTDIGGNTIQQDPGQHCDRVPYCENVPKPQSGTESGTTIVGDSNLYDIILLIDKNETGGASNRNDPTVVLFGKYTGLKHEFRSLKVGDYAWIARCRRTGVELVLPYIVERKRTDDLAASIKDGRFHEQKFRLRRCGVQTVIYLAESHGSRPTGGSVGGLSTNALSQALVNTSVQEGFIVLRSAGRAHSVRLLALLTRRLQRDATNLRASELPTFESFNESATKNRPLTVREMFVKMLLQLRGMSVSRALAVTEVCGTPRALAERGECAELTAAGGNALTRTLHSLFTRDELL